jgi:hypothetical protein
VFYVYSALLLPKDRKYGAEKNKYVPYSYIISLVELENKNIVKETVAQDFWSWFFPLTAPLRGIVSFYNFKSFPLHG